MAGLIEPVGEPEALLARKISQETCAKWGYTCTNYNGKKVQVANYRNAAGHVVAQKVRWPGKKFAFLGDPKAAGLYGQHLWRDGGKRLVITEGEVDALSVSQAQGNRWPVVSVPNGASGAKKAIAAQLEWVQKFDLVIFAFDNDTPGQEAAVACAALLPPGRAAIANFGLDGYYKDANDFIQQGKEKALLDALWGAKPYRPDGLLVLSDLRDRIRKPIEIGLPWAWDALTDLTYGRRYGEVYALGAGTGIGKTDFLTQQIAYDVIELGQPVGLFFMEQMPEETGRRIAGKVGKKLFHIPGAGWEPEEVDAALDLLDSKAAIHVNDHFGVTDWDEIRDKIRFLNKAHDVRIFYLDHLTALAAEADDERKELEKIMAQIGKLVKELDIMLTLVSHLATPEGKPHEEGGRVMIRHFKGARAIGFWCHYMFGMERDQQSEDEFWQRTTTFRVLKDRYTGRATGHTFLLGYDRDTGILFEETDPKGGEDYGFHPILLDPLVNKPTPEHNEEPW